LARAAVGAFTRTALVLAEARLARIAIVRHRALREIPALVSFDHRATVSS
jgi:hypothetical protein